MSASAHSQNANGLVCGLSTRKIRDAVLDPELDHVASSSCHSARQSSRLEVERVDVLVLLRRVLGVLDRAVGPMPEPLRMLASPTDDRASLERDVERDLEVVAPRRVDEAIEVRRACRARARPPCGRPPRRRSPTGCPDRPARGVSVLLRPLRKLRPIGWIGGRYRTSKPIAATYGQPCRRLVERRAARRIGAGRAREHLVPRAEPRALALDEHAQDPLVACGLAPIGCRGHVLRQLGRQRDGQPRTARARRVLERRDGIRQHLSPRRGARPAHAPPARAPPLRAARSTRPGRPPPSSTVPGARSRSDRSSLRRCTRRQPSSSIAKRPLQRSLPSGVHRRLRATRSAPRTRHSSDGGEHVVAVGEDVRLDRRPFRRPCA